MIKTSCHCNSVLCICWSRMLFVCPGSAHSRCVQMKAGGAMSEGRVQLGVGGVVQLSVTFKDAQTALQQLEVPLQVRQRGQRSGV